MLVIMMFIWYNSVNVVVVVVVVDLTPEPVTKTGADLHAAKPDVGGDNVDIMLLFALLG